MTSDIEGDNETPRIPKTAFALLTLIAVFLAIEALSFFLLSFSEGRWMTHGRVRAAQLEVADGNDGPKEPGSEENSSIDLRHEAVHPYLGFVLDTSHRGSRRLELGGQEALDYGFELRSEGIFHLPSPDRPVIAFTGGSVAFELADAAGGNLYDELLEGLGVEQATVINLALPGYKQPQQLMTLSYFLALGAQFDIVVNLDGFNEIALPASENLPTGVDPFFPRLWRFRAQELVPELRIALGKLAFLDDQQQRSAATFANPPYRYSLTAGLLWTVLNRQMSRWAREVELDLRSAHEHSADALSVTGRAVANTLDESTYSSHALLWQRASEEMHHLATGSGFRYLHFLQPNQYLTGSKPMGAEERRTSIQPGHIYGRHAAVAYPLLIEQGRDLAERGVHFVDLTSLFANVEDPVYRDACCHLNDLGQTLLIRAVSSALRAETSRTESGALGQPSTGSSF